MSRPRLAFGGLVVVYLIGVFALTAAWAAFPTPATPGQLPPVTLIPNLTIGVDDGDEKLIFGMIVRVDVDGKGNIYILDYMFSRVGVFDSKGHLMRQIAVPEGQGPRETTGMPGLAVTPGGTLFINDTRKVIVYDPDGGYVRTFQPGFTIISTGCPGTEDLVVLGPHEGKILHVFDAQGGLAASYGDMFRPPQKFESMKEAPIIGAPLRFSCAKDGRVFVLNPHRYEVSVFKDRKLEGVIEGQSDAFQPVRRTGFGFASTVAEIVPSGDLVFVALLTMDPKAKLTADVYQAARRIGTIDLPGEPMVADRHGLIYVAEQEGGPFGRPQREGDFPKVVRYAIIKN
jgi:hypothetical protein